MKTINKFLAGLLSIAMVGLSFSMSSEYSDLFITTSISAATVNGLKNYEASDAVIKYKIENNLAVIYEVVPKNINTRGTTNISIPNVISGYNAVLESGAFSNITAEISVTFPSYFTEIRSYAFKSCLGLKEVNFENGCKSINKNAFYNCSKLSNIRISSKNNNTEVKSFAFNNCPKLFSLALITGELEVINQTYVDTDGVIIIRTDAFHRCNNLTSLALNGGHSGLYISELAFENTRLASDNIYIKKFDSPRLERGNCLSAFGRTLIINVFVPDSSTNLNNWNSKIQQCKDNIKQNINFLYSEVAKYNKYLDITNEYCYVPVQFRPKNVNEGTNPIDPNNIAVKEAIKTLYNINTNNSIDFITNQLKSKGYSNVVYNIIDFSNTHFDAFSRVNTTRYPKQIEYIRSQVNYHYSPGFYTFTHEFLHTAGAMDYYYEGGYNNLVNPSKRYFDSISKKDIMFSQVGSRIGWLTAASVGWTDSTFIADYKEVNWNF